MRLSLISENKLEANEIVKRLKNLDIQAYNFSPHVVEVKTTTDRLDQIKAIIKYAKWQIHSISKPNKNDIVYISITPLKNKELKYGNILYHVTEKRFLEDILQNGLRLKSDTPGMIFPKRIYFYPTIQRAATSYRMAEELGLFANKKGFEPVILIIDNSGGKYKTFLDPEHYMGMGGDPEEDHAVYITKMVAPNDISVMKQSDIPSLSDLRAKMK